MIGEVVKLPVMVDPTLTNAVGFVVGTQLGLYAWVIVEVGDRKIRMEPMDVRWPIDVERTDGSEVRVWTPDDAEPGQKVFCTCGMIDDCGVIEGDDCRSLGCDPLCPAGGCV